MLGEPRAPSCTLPLTLAPSPLPPPHPPAHRSKNPRSEFISIDTTNILFLCGGAFVDLDRQARARGGSGSRSCLALAGGRKGWVAGARRRRQVQPLAAGGPRARRCAGAVLRSPPPSRPARPSTNHLQVSERVAASSIGFGNPVRARGTPSTIAAQSAALQQVRPARGRAWGGRKGSALGAGCQSALFTSHPCTHPPTHFVFALTHALLHIFPSLCCPPPVRACACRWSSATSSPTASSQSLWAASQSSPPCRRARRCCVGCAAVRARCCGGVGRCRLQIAGRALLHPVSNKGSAQQLPLHTLLHQPSATHPPPLAGRR